MARYRVISENGAYLPSSPEVVRLELGGGDSAGARAYGVRAPVFQLFKSGDEITVPAGFIPGPHLEPLDDEAHTAMAAYQKARPGATLDPTRQLPLGIDPLSVRTFEGAIMASLERMAAEAMAAPARPATDDKIDKLIEAMAAQTAAFAALAANLAAPQQTARSK
jgi:hypothetical protein